jgi:hypothetical protein
MGEVGVKEYKFKNENFRCYVYNLDFDGFMSVHI